MLALEIILVIIAVMIIILSLLQGGKAEASASIMGGMGNKSFADLKERGPEKVMSTMTFFLAGAFFLAAILIRIFSTMGN